ncbi:hypothetical protein DRP53_07265 [candidate division WOR-3 bacterium]|uniref:4Fe-4S ferredoxin-type domain-containing protein n=1 Tax=candidate division WOR-3 bacterium TaxID=2052148 RepID=A0A660SGN5_UNCW3|nr:MAG: hypothetical protein DRP53_07265 [candidate division WOR-3 bacterium]
MRRWIIQTIAFFAGNHYFQSIIRNEGFYQGPLKRFCFPYFTCYSCPLAVASCPLGSIQHFLSLQLIPFYVIGFLGLIGVFIGRMVCGYLCPIGFLQDILYRIKSFKFKIPNWLANLKYVFLFGLVVIGAYLTAEPAFCKICPVGSTQAGIPLVLWDPFQSSLRPLIGWHYYFKVSIFALFLLLIISSRRFFCRVMCPLGAIYSLFNRFSILQLRVNKDKCIECNSCELLCPMGIKVYQQPNQADCIRCFECVKKCPTKAVYVGW